MESLGNFIGYLGEKIHIWGKSDSNLETAGDPTLSSRQKASQYDTRPEIGCENTAMITDTESSRRGACESRSNEDVDEAAKDSLKSNILKALHIKGSSTSLNRSPTSGIRSRSSDNGSNPTSVSPFDFKTLVVIPDMSGTKITEVKPNPFGPVSPPVATGIVMSSTTRLNELSPPCTGNTFGQAERTSFEKFNGRRLKTKSESFTGIENFKQRKQKVLKRANSDRLMKVPECNDFLNLPTDVRRAVSDSDALQENDNCAMFTMPKTNMSATSSSSTCTRFQSKISLASRDEESEDGIIRSAMLKPMTDSNNSFKSKGNSNETTFNYNYKLTNQSANKLYSTATSAESAEKLHAETNDLYTVNKSAEKEYAKADPLNDEVESAENLYDTSIIHDSRHSVGKLNSKAVDPIYHSKNLPDNFNAKYVDPICSSSSTGKLPIQTVHHTSSSKSAGCRSVKAACPNQSTDDLVETPMATRPTYCPRTDSRTFFESGRTSRCERKKTSQGDFKTERRSSSSTSDVHDVKTFKTPDKGLMVDKSCCFERTPTVKHPTKKSASQHDLDSTSTVRERSAAEPSICGTLPAVTNMDEIDQQAIDIIQTRKRLLHMQMSQSEHKIRRAQIQLNRSDLPDRQAVSDSSGRIQFGIQYDQNSFTFRVSVARADGIKKLKKISKSTTLFVKVTLKPGRYRKEKSKKVVFSENPDFFEDFEFPGIYIDDLIEMHLKLAVYRKDGFFSIPKLIGETYTSLINYDVYVGKTIWRMLRMPRRRVCILNCRKSYYYF